MIGGTIVFKLGTKSVKQVILWLEKGSSLLLYFIIKLCKRNNIQFPRKQIYIIHSCAKLNRRKRQTCYHERKNLVNREEAYKSKLYNHHHLSQIKFLFKLTNNSHHYESQHHLHTRELDSMLNEYNLRLIKSKARTEVGVNWSRV